MEHIVVVGAGQAGQALVTKLRGIGFEGQVTLVGNEPVPPYQRPPLSKKFLLGEMDFERLLLRPESFYQDQRIALRLGEPVTAINPRSQTINLGPDVLSYDHLALTTGANPNHLPASVGGDLEGVYTVRSLADANAMEPEFRRNRRVLVVGGGYIGLEAAAVASRKGLKVTLIEMSDRILKRVASRETSDFIREIHQSEGVDIRENVGLLRFQGDRHVSGAVLNDGEEIPVDFVIVGIGVKPDIALAEIAGIDIANGIRTDATGRTSMPNIWAAGDCASFPYQGQQIRLESVGNAIDQAEIVAENMLGAEKEYIAKPWFWSDQYDMKLQIAGLNTGYDHVISRKGEHSHMPSFWYFAGPKLLAVDAINDPRAYMVGKRLIESGKSPKPSMIADPQTDLKALLRP